MGPEIFSLLPFAVYKWVSFCSQKSICNTVSPRTSFHVKKNVWVCMDYILSNRMVYMCRSQFCAIATKLISESYSLQREDTT